MQIDNPLIIEFLKTRPADAARALERMNSAASAEFLAASEAEIVAPILAAMLAPTAAMCLALMPVERAVRLIGMVPTAAAARILRSMTDDMRSGLTQALSDRTRGRVQRAMAYPAHSVGALMETEFFLLPVDITVAEAVQRIGQAPVPVNGDVFVVDAAHRLVGAVRVAQLIKSPDAVPLRELLQAPAASIVTRMAPVDALDLPGWAHFRHLPVVEAEGVVVGVIAYAELQRAVSTLPGRGARPDSLASLLSVAGLYWIIVAELFQTLFSRDLRATQKHDARERQ